MFRLFIIIFFIFSHLAKADIMDAEIRIKNHKFHPQTLEVPANTKLKLKVINEDETVEEFESDELRREKIVPAKGYTIIAIGPLKEGKYRFFGEFHQETAQGYILVK